jgi:hypothetical protein
LNRLGGGLKNIFPKTARYGMKPSDRTAESLELAK